MFKKILLIVVSTLLVWSSSVYAQSVDLVPIYQRVGYDGDGTKVFRYTTQQAGAKRLDTMLVLFDLRDVVNVGVDSQTVICIPETSACAGVRPKIAIDLGEVYWNTNHSTSILSNYAVGLKWIALEDSMLFLSKPGTSKTDTCVQVIKAKIPKSRFELLRVRTVTVSGDTIGKVTPRLWIEAPMK